MKLLVHTVVLLLLFASCKKDEEENTPGSSGPKYTFYDSFEEPGPDGEDLFPEDGSRWTNLQIVSPDGETNTWFPTTNQAVTGDYSVYFEAAASGSPLSKMCIEKNGLEIREGDRVTIEARFFIASTAILEGLHLIDLESCNCWDPNVPNNQCPGVRVMLGGGNDFPTIERGKISQPNYFQNSVQIPRFAWFRLKWVMDLSPNDSEGFNQLYLNDDVLISSSGMNMPNAEIFANIFEDAGQTFVLQEPVVYHRIQVGATANPTSYDIPLYVDDVRITVE